MTNTNLATTVKNTVEAACELSETWVGTAIADKLDTETNAVIKGVEDGQLDRVETILLPQLITTMGFAENQLDHQEG